jgi:hypothetical protein
VKLAGSLARAESVTTAKQAARLYNDLEQELSLGTYTEDDADEAEQAISVLEQNWPGVKGAARNVTSPPKLSRSAWSNSTGGVPSSSRPSPAPAPAAPSTQKPPAAQTTQGPRQSAPRPRPGRRSSSPRSRGPRFAPTPGAALAAADVGGWGSLFGQFMLWGIGLSIAYLALTKSTAIAKLGLGATNIARAVVSPSLDPLNPKGAT